MLDSRPVLLAPESQGCAARMLVSRACAREQTQKTAASRNHTPAGQAAMSETLYGVSVQRPVDHTPLMPGPSYRTGQPSNHPFINGVGYADAPIAALVRLLRTGKDNHAAFVLKELCDRAR